MMPSPSNRQYRGGSSSRVNVYSRMFLTNSVRSLLCLDVCLPYRGIVAFQDQVTMLTLGLRMKVLHQLFVCLFRGGLVFFFSCIKTKEFSSAVLKHRSKKKTVATAVTLQPSLQARAGPALSIGFQFCFGGLPLLGNPPCLQNRCEVFFFVLLFFYLGGGGGRGFVFVFGEEKLKEMFTLPSF